MQPQPQTYPVTQESDDPVVEVGIAPMYIGAENQIPTSLQGTSRSENDIK